MTSATKERHNSEALPGRLSLRWRISFLIVLGGVVSAVFTTLCFATFDLIRSRKQVSVELASAGNLVSVPAAAAIARNDREEAHAVLAAFRINPYVRQAALYRAGAIVSPHSPRPAAARRNQPHNYPCNSQCCSMGLV